MASLKNLLLTTTPVTPVSIANGGTGATDAATARANLGATGTVSSVGLSLPATFTVSNSPVTGAGTLTAVWASQTANQVLAAPNGASGTPTFRALVAADIPTLNQNTTGTAANVTGTVAIANGGTGQTTQQAALNAIAGAVTSGSYLRGNGTNVVMSTIQAADIPTLNQNTTGTASNVTGIVAIANGGTGQNSRQAAINALAGATTNAFFLRGNGTNVVMAAISASDIPTLNQNTTGTAANVTGTVAVANGGTGLTTLTANNVILGNGTSAVQFVAPGTTGNVLISNGTTWVSGTVTTGGAINNIFYENNQTVTADYTITSSKNAMSAGDITIASGVTVTIPSGSKWTVV